MFVPSSLSYAAAYWGHSSLAGQHEDSDPKQLSLFDIAPARRGVLGPERFLELFGELNIAPYLGEFVWDDDFVSQVRRDGLDGVTFEGVVGKVGEGHALVMAKAKTQAWVDRILEHHGEEKGRRLINS